MAMLILAQLVGDACGTAYMILAASLRQTVMPAETLGRAAGAFSAAQGGAMLVGALVAGAAAAGLRHPRSAAGFRGRARRGSVAGAVVPGPLEGQGDRGRGRLRARKRAAA